MFGSNPSVIPSFIHVLDFSIILVAKFSLDSYVSDFSLLGVSRHLPVRLCFGRHLCFRGTLVTVTHDVRPSNKAISSTS